VSGRTVDNVRSAVLSTCRRLSAVHTVLPPADAVRSIDADD
jgi:hypothetical protein